jgi:y4mF family transcriptional regulator
MQVKTMRELGALVRAGRHAQGMTQAELAAKMGVGRDWVVRLEQGYPRLEAQRVLDAVTVLGLVLTVDDQPIAPTPDDKLDPFAELFEGYR